MREGGVAGKKERKKNEGERERQRSRSTGQRDGDRLKRD